MSVQDPISNMLTSIRNAQAANHPEVMIPYSKVKQAIAHLLKEEGYLSDVVAVGEGVQKRLTLTLKYFDGGAVITSLDRVSKPSRRVYVSATDVPQVLEGLGIAVISTSAGLMTDRNARAKGLGGEVICTVT